jgi:hypothetical protein
MLMCKDCEFCRIGQDGQVQITCNPFTNIKEPECLLKHQLLRLDVMTRAYMTTIAEYKKIAPLQEKLYRHMSREVDEMDEADKWKRASEEEDEDDEPPPAPPLDDRR